uniref:IS66 family transposase n=1 Tax=Rhodoferax sp. TaxID=50421 RepID=UPI00351D998D
MKLRHAQFGASSERLSPQTELFAEVLDLPLPPVVKQKISYERKHKGPAHNPAAAAAPPGGQTDRQTWPSQRAHSHRR